MPTVAAVSGVLQHFEIERLLERPMAMESVKALFLRALTLSIFISH
jgi:hypothetical protein